MNAVMPARAGSRIGLGVDHVDAGLGAVGDPHLAAVQHVVVAVPDRFQPHADHVGAGVGLGHGQRADVLAAAQLRQVLLLLFFAAVLADLVDTQV